MAVTGEIQWDEGPFNINNGGAQCALRYILTSDDPVNDDREDAMQWLLDNAPADLFNLRPDGFNVEELIRDINNAAEKDKKWFGSVQYVNAQRKKPKPLVVEDPLQVRLSIRSGTGGSVNQLYSRDLRDEIYSDSVYRFGLDPLIDRGLGFQVDNSEDNGSQFTIKGISVPIGTVELVVETLIANNTIVGGYLISAAQEAAAQKVNEKTWRGFPAHSVKLLNVDAQQQGGETGDTDSNPEAWEVVYTMAFSREISAAELNNNLPPGLSGRTWSQSKRGWDYLDILYVDSTYAPSPGISMLIPAAKRAAIHQIYEDLDFNATLKI